MKTKPRASKAGKPISPSRRVAFEILTLVGEDRGNSDDLLHGHHTDALSPEDRNLATTLVLGVLRWQIALDARIQSLLDRPGQRLAEAVALPLRMGVFQLLHLDRIPPHAAIDESVELTRAGGNPHAAGMVNAILRRLASAPAPGKPLHESTAAFAERLGHPLWLVERWVSLYGRQAAVNICEAGQREPGEPRLFGETPDLALPQIDDGSRLVAELAATASPDARRVWDTCAAPGGKTLVLARSLPEAEVLATDASARRLEHMRSRLKQYPYASHVRMSVGDAASPSPDLGDFDLILCDAPCSGTGTLGRNPEIRHRLRPQDLVRQAMRQRSILSAALNRLAPGGRLVYSTCSLEPEECEEVVDSVAAKQAVHVLPVQPILDSLCRTGVLRLPLERAAKGNFLRTLPGTHPGDGFFAALLQRD